MQERGHLPLRAQANGDPGRRPQEDLGSQRANGKRAPGKFGPRAAEARWKPGPAQADHGQGKDRWNGKGPEPRVPPCLAPTPRAA
eukprot:15686263-Heterocapsa_arctica.AAC.1